MAGAQGAGVIDQLFCDLKETRTPTRELDCRLHEVLTGQIDMQKDRKEYSRQMARVHGNMLVDLGAERLVIVVPKYTWIVEDAAKLLPKDASYGLSFIPIGHAAYGNYPFAAILRNKRLDVENAASSHLSFAHAVCLLALTLAMGKSNG